MKVRFYQIAVAGFLRISAASLSAQTVTDTEVTPVSAQLLGGIDPHIKSPEVKDDTKGYLTFFLDNDLFNGTDENYTNGARLSYITEGEPIINLPIIQDNLHLFSGGSESLNWTRKLFGFRNPAQVEYSWGFALTQLMFTPTDPFAEEPAPGERPYAGWAGIGFSLHTRDSHAQNSVELNIGVVGPAAYARETQNLVHDLRGIERFEGWDSQIPNEVTLNLHTTQRRRIEFLDKWQSLPLGLRMDGYTETGFALGNFRTDAHAGFLVRAGWNLPVEFADARLSPTAHSQRIYSGGSNTSDWSLYALFGAQVNLVLYDISLDGPLFRNFDTGVDRELLVGDFYAGFGLRYKGCEFSYVHTFRTKTFETQDGSQAFGSLAIRLRF